MVHGEQLQCCASAAVMLALASTKGEGAAIPQSKSSKILARAKYKFVRVRSHLLHSRSAPHLIETSDELRHD
jgi:hypothetical protein